MAAGKDMSLSPPLKWAGGKRWQVPHLREYWAGHETRRLVEPFCGGLAVTLGLSPARALANDINASLINFYRWLQRGLTVDVEMDNEESLYYRQRDRFNALLTTGEDGGAEAAALFYYLNRTGFNRLCRFNRSGMFNVPFGEYPRINLNVTKRGGEHIALASANRAECPGRTASAKLHLA